VRIPPAAERPRRSLIAPPPLLPHPVCVAAPPAGHLLPAPTEITTFEHNCTTAPCVVTQLHCPTAGPNGWDAATLKIYIDGEAEPSIAISLLELANLGNFAHGTEDDGPWGIGLLGHTASNGGVYSTVRIPFSKSIRSTITSDSAKPGTFWFIIRGVEAYPIALGDVTLPPTARLKLHRLNTSTTALQLVTLVDIPSGTAGAVLNLKFDAAGASYGYLEACMRFFPDQATEPLFLSSGAEDYFLSAYYFNEGQFKTPNSGLTYYDKKGTLSAYKTHDRDPLFFNDGLKMVFRNTEDTTGCGDTTHCPNQYCAPGAAPDPSVPLLARGARDAGGAPEQAPDVDADYNTLVWVYEWPAASADAEEAAAADMQPAAGAAAALSTVARLGGAGLLSASEEDALVDGLLGGDAALEALVGAYAANDDDARAARQLRRWVARTQ
jgi:hypothetical protein